MKNKIIALSLVLVPLISVADSTNSSKRSNKAATVRAHWERLCRQFATDKISTQNCESVYQDVVADLTEADRVRVLQESQLSKLCKYGGRPYKSSGTTKAVGHISRACRLHQIEIAVLIKEKGKASCDFDPRKNGAYCLIDGRSIRFETLNIKHIAAVNKRESIRDESAPATSVGTVQ